MLEIVELQVADMCKYHAPLLWILIRLNGSSHEWSSVMCVFFAARSGDLSAHANQGRDKSITMARQASLGNPTRDTVLRIRVDSIPVCRGVVSFWLFRNFPE